MSPCTFSPAFFDCQTLPCADCPAWADFDALEDGVPLFDDEDVEDVGP